MRMWLATLLILLSVFVAGCDKPIITVDLKGQPSIPAQPAPPRFQLVMHPELPGIHRYLLDTQTGAMWQPVKYKGIEGEPEVWQRCDVVDGVAPSSGQHPENLLNWFSWQKEKKTEAK